MNCVNDPYYYELTNLIENVGLYFENTFETRNNALCMTPEHKYDNLQSKGVLNLITNTFNFNCNEKVSEIVNSKTDYIKEINYQSSTPKIPKEKLSELVVEVDKTEIALNRIAKEHDLAVHSSLFFFKNHIIPITTEFELGTNELLFQHTEINKIRNNRNDSESVNDTDLQKNELVRSEPFFVIPVGKADYVGYNTLTKKLVILDVKTSEAMTIGTSFLKLKYILQLYFYSNLILRMINDFLFYQNRYESNNTINQRFGKYYIKKKSFALDDLELYVAGFSVKSGLSVLYLLKNDMKLWFECIGNTFLFTRNLFKMVKRPYCLICNKDIVNGRCSKGCKEKFECKFKNLFNNQTFVKILSDKLKIKNYRKIEQ